MKFIPYPAWCRWYLVDVIPVAPGRRISVGELLGVVSTALLVLALLLD